MNLPIRYSQNDFKPLHALMHGLYDTVLALTTGLCESKMSFIILWDDEFHAVHHYSHGIKNFHSTDFSLYKERFGKLKASCFYAPNTKYHTLFQDLYFFKHYEQYAKALIYPILDDKNQVCGLIGVLHPENPAPLEQNKHTLKELSKHASKLQSEHKVKRRNNQPKPLLLQSLNQLPGAHYEFIISPEGQLGFPNVSEELINMHPHFWDIAHLSCPDSIFRLLHRMDFHDFRTFLLEKQGGSSVEFSYALKNERGITKYYMVRVNTYLNEAGETLCFGVVKDISLQKAYENVLEQIIFDISHVMRRPVATMQGLTQLIELDKMNKETVKEVAHKLQLVSNEMDAFIKKLYINYQQRWEELEDSEKR